MDKENEDVNINHMTSSLGSIKERGESKNSIIDYVRINNEPLKEDVKEVKKRKRQAETEVKRLEEENYNRQMQELQYKRLMHLLNRSKFYASYLVKKISGDSEDDGNKINRINKKKAISTKSPLPLAKGEKKSYSKQSHISKDVQDKLKSVNMIADDKDVQDKIITDSENQNSKANDIDIEIPKYFNGILRDYQIDGFQWLKVLYENGINGILADEMGLGKTVQLIALFAHLIEKRQAGPYLIIAPLSTVPNWLIEFERFAPKLPIILLHGTPEERYSAVKEIKQMHRVSNHYSTLPIVLTTFEVPLTEKQFIRSQHWRYIVIDEGHRIKNPNCMLVTILKTCKSMNRLLLTGTPLQNNLSELWSLLNFLLPEIFDDLAVFKSWFNAKELEYDEGTKKFLKQEEEKHVLSSLREILQPFMLRREKADVCLEVPPKKELIVYAPLTQLQHDLYKAVLNRDIQKLSLMDEKLIIDTEDGKRPKRKCTKKIDFNGYFGKNHSEDNLLKKYDESAVSKTSPQKMFTDVLDRNLNFIINVTPISKIIMYKKIVNHPYLVHCPLDASGLPKVDNELIASSGKLLVLDAMLAKLKERGHKVLLFSTMTMILDVIEDYLSLRDYNYVRLDGSTPLAERKDSIQDFNTNPDLFLFLISTRAGGIGLNLAAADTVIIYDSDWNPQVDIQAMARCHRIGQNRPVVVYKFCTKGTIDETIISRGEKKRFLEKVVISKKNDPINMHNKESLLELKRLLESRECEVVKAENEVFTNEELNKLLDRSDLYEEHKKS
ncbi:lymphocyte-specific helicase-like [Colletes gigas]|uniref:lymphocyte-specific helicase-like n=1 Tax=Colletes gigas TaxID=935657 RepID=UPI001C9A5A87|nr:lymphocyte-specific helicase-like [Colletes gigas]